MNRRDFLLQTGALAAGAMLPGQPLPALPRSWGGAADGARVAIVHDPRDPVAAARPAQWAIERLRQTLATRGFAPRVLTGVAEVPTGELCVVAGGRGSTLVRGAGVGVPTNPESLALAPARLGERAVLVAAGSDARGLVYALTELADAVALEPDPARALAPAAGVVERPANRVRSVIRLFVSDVQDKPWFNDRDFWRRYFALLAGHRFNRVNLSLGLGYDRPDDLADTYFYFAYPFLVSVPGYAVRATNLPDAERDRNLETLRFISDEAAGFGLDFQLGLWTHAYQWTNSPQANHVIEGLTPRTQAAYCRDALALLLRECPNITGVTLRIHGESGVPEGSYGLWRTIFDGCVRGGRRVPLDLHAKGLDEPTLNAALALGVPLTISPKFWAEHMGLPYHQAAIRPTDVPTGRPGRGPFTHSEGDRSFTRYGYADFLREDRRWAIVHRLWPGTQRMLLWGDPALAAAYSRRASFCGTDGLEVFDPLSFKGRKGSGLPGGRDGYADRQLRAPGDDFEKYRIGYRVWGRRLYDPYTPAAIWDRQLRADYGPAAPAAGVALARASRILPLLTTAHMPSAANNHFWPEMYWNQAIADPAEPIMPYPDTPEPRRFGTTSPLDPQLFSRIEDHADGLLAGRPSGKYSPVEVAQWLEDLAQVAEGALDAARAAAPEPRTPAFRRFASDTQVLIDLGRFFGAKLRAGVLYAIYGRTADPDALKQALAYYRAARGQWAHIAEITADVYAPDVTYGPAWYQRGHWSDRLAPIDKDIAAMERAATTPSLAAPTPTAEKIAGAVKAVLGRPVGRPAGAYHTPPRGFRPGRPVELALQLPVARGRRRVLLHYRHTNQAEPWREGEMRARGAVLHGTIPGPYTDTPYPLQYYFEVIEGSGPAWLHPGLGTELTQQPYFVLRSGDRALSAAAAG